MYALQPTAEHQGSGPAPGTQLRPSASGSSLVLPAGINPEDIAEGSIRFFHDDLCLSIPFKGEHFMSSEAIKALSPRELILIYEVRSPLSIIMSAKSCCSPTSIYSRVHSLVGVTDCVVLALCVHAGLCLWGTCLAFSKPGKVWHHDVLTRDDGAEVCGAAAQMSAVRGLRTATAKCFSRGREAGKRDRESLAYTFLLLLLKAYPSILGSHAGA